MIRYLMVLLALFALVSCDSSDKLVVSGIGDDGYPPIEGPAPVLSYRVVNTYPHQTDAFTQGLLYKDGLLYESTGLVDQSTLREVDLTSGAVLRQQNLSGVFAEGLALRNGIFYQLTLDSGFAILWDGYSFLQVGTLPIPTPAWGLTLTDDDLLAFSDGSSIIRFLDPDDLSEVRRINVTDDGNNVTLLNELEFIDGFLYANRYGTDEIAIIDPYSGELIFRLDLTGLIDKNYYGLGSEDVLNGIAFDPDQMRLFVTGKRWPYVYHIEILQ